MTFNHAPYITDALNGFVKQETSFPYVAVIIDDASTDNNQEAIKEFFETHFNTKEDVSWTKEDDYAQYYYARHKENRNCYFVILFLKENHFGDPTKVEHIKEWEDNSKYIALCEGDDYWTNPKKLQLQVDYMEKHEECGLCYTDCDMYVEKSGKWIRRLSGGREVPIDGKNPLLQENAGYRFNMTWLFRKRLFDSFNPNPGFLDGAMYLLCNFCLVSALGYIPTITGVYRRHEGSASCFRPNQRKEQYLYKKSIFELTKYFAPKFDTYEVILRRVYSEGLLNLLPYAFHFEDNQIIQDFELFYKGSLDIHSYKKGLSDFKINCENNVRSSKSYKIGRAILSPLFWAKRIV